MITTEEIEKALSKDYYLNPFKAKEYLQFLLEENKRLHHQLEELMEEKK